MIFISPKLSLNRLPHLKRQPILNNEQTHAIQRFQYEMSFVCIGGGRLNLVILLDKNRSKYYNEMRRKYYGYKFYDKTGT